MAHDSYSALSDPTRRRILTALSHGARPVGELVRELEVSQPTVSKHLKVLRDVGLVTTRAEGQRRYYSIEAETLAGVARWIEELIGYLPAPVPEAEPEALEAQTGPAPEAVASETEPEAVEAPEPEEEPEAQRQPAASEPEAAEEPEPPAPQSRALPWFTAVEAAQTEVEEQLEAPGAVEGAEPESEAIPVPEPTAQQSRGGTDPAAEGPHTELPDGRTEETVREESAISQAGNRDAGSTVETNTDVDSAESSEDSHGSAESPLTKPESGLPPVRSGAAHRRQGGLLSTLTGFRRRGRGPRR